MKKIIFQSCFNCLYYCLVLSSHLSYCVLVNNLMGNKLSQRAGGTVHVFLQMRASDPQLVINLY